MNAEELSLEEVVVGPRGAGKTLLLTHFSAEKLMHARAVKLIRELTGNENAFPRHKTRVFANYPVKIKARIPGMSGPEILETEMLDLERLITWQEEFRDCYIIYDEIDQDADRQDWSAQVPKYLVRGIKLMRHRNISLLASLQFLDELNMRLYKQADIVIQCRDLAYTPWGRERGLNPGEEINTTFLDKSGILTGYTYEETHKVYPLLFAGKRYWNAYSTTHDFSVVKPVISIEREKRVIMPAEEAEAQEADRQRFYNAVSYVIFNNKPEDRVLSSMSFKNALVEFGCMWTDNQISREAARLGVLRYEKKGVKGWDFRNVDVDKAIAN